MNIVDKQNHEYAMRKFLLFVNSVSKQFVLKGGTAIRLCYGLDRFSEDVDLDAVSENIISICDSYCKQNKITFTTKKNTQIVKRCYIHYGKADNQKFKCEVSYRRGMIDYNRTQYVNGILTYKVNELLAQKCFAYQGRDKVRDLYDIVYLCKHFSNQFSQYELSNVRETLLYKNGLAQFDYLERNSPKDPYVDMQSLSDNFLALCYALHIQ